jgi:hypothetical protein
VDPVAEVDGQEPEQIVAFVGFLSPGAPTDALRRGARMELFRGTEPIGVALVTLAAGLDDSARGR